MKNIFHQIKKHSTHAVKHFHKHRHRYGLGTFGAFAVVKSVLLLAGFLGILNIANIFAQEVVEVNSGNIVTEYGCATDAGSCDLSSKGITSIAADTFVNHTNLQILYLSSNGITSIDSGDFAGLANLTYLHLSSNQISLIDSGAFAGLANLQVLYLSSNGITSIENCDFTGLSNLYYLNLVNSNINSIESGSFAGLANLTELYLNSNQLSSIESGTFAGLANLTRLELANSNINSIESGAFAGLANLTRLDLNDNQITGINLVGLISLQKVYFQNNQLTSINLSGLTSLQDLTLFNNQLTGIDLTGLTGLQQLILANNLLTSIDLTGLTGLQEIYLSNNQLTGIDLTGLTGLQKVYLSNNQLTGIDLTGLTGLQQLLLSTNLLTTLPESTTGLINLSFLELDYNCRNIGSMSSELIAFLDSKAGYNTWQSEQNPACSICDNGIIENDEECDGDNLNGKSCESLGYDTGTLSCNSCNFDINACSLFPIELPIEDFCTLYELYTQKKRAAAGELARTMINRGFFNVSQFPYPYYIGAIAKVNAEFGQIGVLAQQRINTVLQRQAMPEIQADPVQFRDAVTVLEPMMLSGPVPNMYPFNGTLYNQGINTLCAPPILEECGNGIIEGDEQCDSNNFNEYSNRMIRKSRIYITCSTFGYSLGTLSCTPSCTVDTSNCSNPPFGGGGGGGGSTPLYPDNCPDGDFSPSYYDGICGTSPQQPSHGSAEINTTAEFKDTALTRKTLAQLASVFAQEVLGLTPNENMSCIFSDITKLSTSEQQTIINACRLNIMGLHKNGLNTKRSFEPNKYVNKKEFATVLSRILYNGKYNIPLTSSIDRRTNHVIHIQNIGLMPTGPKVMLSFALDAFSYIKNNLELIQRSELTTHSATTTNTQTIPVIISNPTQAISNATKSITPRSQ